MHCAVISLQKRDAKIVYEALINFTDDQGTIDALQFPNDREISHMKALQQRSQSMGKPEFSIAAFRPQRDS